MSLLSSPPVLSFFGNLLLPLGEETESFVARLITLSDAILVVRLLVPCLAAAAVTSLPVVMAVEDDCFDKILGPGKFFFLSILLTRRWNFLNNASARMRVLSRSMVLESSLTESCG